MVRVHVIVKKVVHIVRTGKSNELLVVGQGGTPIWQMQTNIPIEDVQVGYVDDEVGVSMALIDENNAHVMWSMAWR